MVGIRYDAVHSMHDVMAIGLKQMLIAVCSRKDQAILCNGTAT